MGVLIGFLERIPRVGRYVVLIFQRHVDMQAAIDLVVRELEYNAGQVGRRGASPQSIRGRLDLSAWDAHRQQILVRTRRHPEVRDQVTDVYDKLQQTAAYAGPNPSEDEVRAAAEALREIR
jgi:hypothetical protein